MEFVEEAEKTEKKIYRANFRGPICILQIFRNNPSRGVWLYYQILMMANMSKTEIYAKILKRKKSNYFLSESHQKLFSSRPGYGLSFKPNMKQSDEAVQALACAKGFLRPSWILLKKLKNEKKKFSQIPQGQYAYGKYLEIIRVGVFKWEQEQLADAEAGGLSKNNKSPPPHRGWKLNYQV